MEPLLITPVERAAASAVLGCRPWELGPVLSADGQLMRRYGRFAARGCSVCRAVLTGK